MNPQKITKNHVLREENNNIRTREAKKGQISNKRSSLAKIFDFITKNQEHYS